LAAADNDQLTSLLAAADSNNWEFFCKFFNTALVWFLQLTKCSELLKAAADKSHGEIVRELLKIGASVKVSKKHV
jgi:histone acetyltransferase (RNA polymerase elongator complex component)